MHLNSDDLVDIAEGTRPASAEPHLAGCEECRARLDDLRAMLSVARDVAVPEPSPLFWDHLSSRVSHAIAADAANVRSRAWRPLADTLAASFTARPFLSGVVAAAAALLFAVVVAPRNAPPSAPQLSPSSVAVAAAEPLTDVTADDDASLKVVASLTDEADMETVREAGLATRGSAEHAVTHMTSGELRELGRILQEELARSGA
jgi:hypothetical protein